MGSETKFQRDKFVSYHSRAGKVQAITRVIHRDGSVTVEPRFYVEDGKTTGNYIGGRVRIEAERLVYWPTSSALTKASA